MLAEGILGQRGERQVFVFAAYAMAELKRGLLAPQHEDRLRQGTYALLHEAAG